MNISLVSKIELLCSTNNISVTQLEKKLNFARGSIRRWDNNMPSIEKVIKITDYFHVSFDSLLGLNNDQRYISKATMKRLEDHLSSVNKTAIDLTDNLSYIDYKMFFDFLINYSILNSKIDTFINNMDYSEPPSHPLDNSVHISENDVKLFSKILNDINDCYNEILSALNNSLVITNNFLSKSFQTENSISKNQEYIQIVNSINNQLNSLKLLIPQLFLIYSTCHLTDQETVQSYNDLEEAILKQGINPNIKMKDYAESTKDLWSEE